MDDYKAKVGTCLTMCPPSQFIQTHSGVLIHEGGTSAFEYDPVTNKFDENLAITKYERSEADKEFLPENIRPLPVLVKTMDHILNYVIGKRLNSQEEGTSYLDLYHYLRDRFRAIEQEIIIQKISGAQVIDILQKMVLFFVWGGGMFSEYPEDQFSLFQNQQILEQTFSLLEEQYEIFREENNGMMSMYESNFTAMKLLMFISNEEFMSQLMLLDKCVLSSEPIKRIIKLKEALLNSEFKNVVQIINESDLYFALLALENLFDFWDEEMYGLRKSLGYAFTIDFIKNNFDFTDDNLAKFVEAFHVKKYNEFSENIVLFDAKQQVDESNLPRIVITKTIKEIFDRTDIVDFLCYKVSNDSFKTTLNSSNFQKKIETPKQDKPLIEENKLEIKEEKSNHITKNNLKTQKKEDNFCEIKKDINFTQEKTKTIDIKQQKVQTEKEEVKYFQCKPIYLSLPLKIISMLPPNLPKFCYASLLIKSSDFSESSIFVNSQLEIDNQQPVIFLKQINLSGTTILISIFHQITENSNNIRCVLNCEDTNSEGDYNFHKYESNSPYLNFDSILRKSFVSSISEFYPCDLTNIIKRIIYNGFKILESPKWVNSSANSVIIFINKIIKEIVNNLKSNEFISKIIPFIHGIFSRNDLLKIINVIENLELPLIKNEESTKPIENSSWPMYIRDNISISIHTFFVPIDIEFNQDQFISQIIKKFENEFPDDYVNLSYLDNNFDLILNSFDIDL